MWIQERPWTVDRGLLRVAVGEQGVRDKPVRSVGEGGSRGEAPRLACSVWG